MSAIGVLHERETIGATGIRRAVRAPPGGAMSAQWGALLEAELAGAGVVRSYALSHAWAGADPDRVRSRRAPSVLFASQAQARAAATAVWTPDRVLYLREVPALRIDTTRGRLLLADLWGDTGFRPMATRAGAGVLRLDSPLCALLDAVATMTDHAGRPAAIVTLPIGWHRTQPVGRRDALAAWATVVGHAGSEPTFAWQAESNEGVGDGPWAAFRAFGYVNSREEILRSARLMASAERRVEASAIPGGHDIGEIEDYLRAMASGEP